MAEISQELQTIVTGRYGSDIRMAIHDAIQKVNVSSGSGGGGVAHGPVGNMKQELGGYDNTITTGFLNARTMNPVEYVQDSSVTSRSSASLTINVLGRHTVIGIVIATGQFIDVTGLGSTWTTVYDDGILIGQQGGLSTKMQAMIVKRTGSYENVTLEATTPLSETICMKLIVLNQNEDVVGTTFTKMTEDQYSPAAPTSDTLYVTAQFYDGDISEPSYTAYPEDSAVQMTVGTVGAFYKKGNSGSIRFDYKKHLEFPEWGAALLTTTLS